MPVEITRCPKCRGEMELGALVLRRHNWKWRSTEWMEGLLERSFWTGLKVGGRRRIPLRTNRCRECGFLESYAIKR